MSFEAHYRDGTQAHPGDLVEFVGVENLQQRWFEGHPGVLVEICHYLNPEVIVDLVAGDSLELPPSELRRLDEDSHRVRTGRLLRGLHPLRDESVDAH